MKLDLYSFNLLLFEYSLSDLLLRFVYKFPSDNAYLELMRFHHMSAYRSPMINKKLPNLKNSTTQLNFENQKFENLEGKVILLQFWTFGCYNCVNTLPYVKKWYNELKQEGVEFITIHTPEFSFEKDEENVRNALKKFNIEYPVLMDNNFDIWNSFNNRWWPHFFLVDKNGIIRYNFVGEGNYDTIRKLLIELNSEN